jgi:hypothetical protein
MKNCLINNIHNLLPCHISNALVHTNKNEKIIQEQSYFKLQILERTITLNVMHPVSYIKGTTTVPTLKAHSITLFEVLKAEL